MELFRALFYVLLLAAVLGFFVYQYLYGPGPRNFKKIMARFGESVEGIPFFKDIKKMDSRQYLVIFNYRDKEFKLDCNLVSKSSYSLSSHRSSVSYQMEFAYSLPYEKPKQITKLELFRLPKYARFLNYIIPSTADIAGNEDRSFRVIYEYSGDVDKEILKKTIEQLVSVNDLKSAGNIPFLEKIIVGPGKVTVQTGKPVEYTEKLKEIFDLLLALSAAKVAAVEIKRDPEEDRALNLLKAVLSDINALSVGNGSLYSDDFMKKFKVLLEESKAETRKTGVKISVSMSSFPQVRIHVKNTDTLKAVITDVFPIKSVPFVPENENASDEKSKWELVIDKKTGKLEGMDEDIWGNYRI